MIKRILPYILFCCAFVSVTFFAIGLLCFLAGWILLGSTNKLKDQAAKKEIRKMVDQLKENGDKIIVDLLKCEIKSNDYSEEQDRFTSGILATSYESDIQAWNNLLGDEMANVKMVDIYQTVLIYRHHYMSQDKTFISEIISTEHTTLLFKLDNQKTTFIYVDKQDSSKYYFDLDFLLPQ
jgi:hypothetical protein